MGPSRTRPLPNALAAAGLLALLVVACGGGEPRPAGETGTPDRPATDAGTAQAGEGEQGELIELRVGFLPIAGYAYLWQAQDAGYFEDEGLDVELVTAPGGAAIIPALQAGSMDLGVSEIVAVLNAQDAGIDARFVSFNFYESEEAPTHAVVTNDPSVRTPADLVDQRVATNVLLNLDWLLVREWLRLHDVDPESVSYTEVPFPDQIGALDTGSIPAAGMIEPFYTIAESQGMTVLGNYFTEVRPIVPTAGVIATQAYIDEHPDVVRRFVAAVERALQDGIEDESLVRDLIVEHTPTPPEVAEEINLQEWRLAADIEGIQFIIDLAEAEDLFDTEFTPEDILWSEAKRE
ncbi:hypothetical protein BH20CHL2_BH20CHL2_07820 [soil metagenome]